MTVSAIAPQLAAAATGPDRPGDSGPAAERKKVGAQFEAILIRQLLNKSLTSLLGPENNTANAVYGDMLTDRLAQQLSAGQGLGLGRIIETQLAPRGTPAANPPNP